MIFCSKHLKEMTLSMIEVKESFKIIIWGEYVRQLIRQLIRVVSCLCRRERTSSGTGQPALGRKGCCLGESPFCLDRVVG